MGCFGPVEPDALATRFVPNVGLKFHDAMIGGCLIVSNDIEAISVGVLGHEDRSDAGEDDEHLIREQQSVFVVPAKILTKYRETAQ